MLGSKVQLWAPDVKNQSDESYHSLEGKNSHREKQSTEKRILEILTCGV